MKSGFPETEPSPSVANSGTPRSLVRHIDANGSSESDQSSDSCGNSLTDAASESDNSSSVTQPQAFEVRASPSPLHRVLSLAGMGVCVQAIATVFGGVHAVVELASHTSMHTLIFAMVLLPFLLFFKEKRLAACVSIAVVYLLYVTQPWGLIPGEAPSIAKDRSVLRVLSWNVLAINKSFDEITSIVSDVDPDVIVFIEVRPKFLDGIPEIAKSYPYFVARPSWGGEGIAVLSRVKDTKFQLADFEFAQQPAVIASIPKRTSSLSPSGETTREHAANIELVAFHPLSPLPTNRAPTRNRQIRAFLNWSNDQQGPVVVCGDLNITPWAGPFREIIRNGFVDSRIGSGNCASWPSPFGVLGIPIDHALSKGDCQIFERGVWPTGPGSDHRPIFFSIAY